MGDSYFSIGLNYSTINDSLAILYLKKSLQFKPNYKEAEKIIKESLKIAGDVCIYSNQNHLIETINW